MKSRQQRLFDYDRSVELRLRFAIKRKLAAERTIIPKTGALQLVENEVVDRLIERVRHL